MGKISNHTRDIRWEVNFILTPDLYSLFPGATTDINVLVIGRYFMHVCVHVCVCVCVCVCVGVSVGVEIHTSIIL